MNPKLNQTLAILQTVLLAAILVTLIAQFIYTARQTSAAQNRRYEYKAIARRDLPGGDADLVEVVIGSRNTIDMTTAGVLDTIGSRGWQYVGTLPDGAILMQHIMEGPKAEMADPFSLTGYTPPPEPKPAAKGKK